MRYLIDTNILVRLSNSDDPKHGVASEAVERLTLRGGRLYLTPQTLIEFRGVATRPKAVNGLGFSLIEAENQMREFESVFPLLEDTPAIFPLWKNLVAAAGVIGKQVHDARLVAVCHAHGVTHLLTFNGPHFARLTGFGPGIEVVDPAAV